MTVKTPLQHYTTPSDRFWLKWTRTLPASQIKQEVSLAVMEKAMNRRRIGINIGICVLASIGALSYGISFSRQRRKMIADIEDEHYK